MSELVAIYLVSIAILHVRKKSTRLGEVAEAKPRLGFVTA